MRIISRRNGHISQFKSGDKLIRFKSSRYGDISFMKDKNLYCIKFEKIYNNSIIYTIIDMKEMNPFNSFYIIPLHLDEWGEGWEKLKF